MESLRAIRLLQINARAQLLRWISRDTKTTPNDYKTEWSAASATGDTVFL